MRIMKAEGTPLQGSFLGLNYLWGDAPQLSELAHEVGSAGYGLGIFIGRMPVNESIRLYFLKFIRFF